MTELSIQEQQEQANIVIKILKRWLFMPDREGIVRMPMGVKHDDQPTDELSNPIRYDQATDELFNPIRYDHNERIFQMIARNNLHIHTDIHGQTLFHVIVARGYSKLLKILLENGFVSPTAQDDKGRTVLFLAAENGHTTMILQLLNLAAHSYSLSIEGILEAEEEESKGLVNEPTPEEIQFRTRQFDSEQFQEEQFRNVLKMTDSSKRTTLMAFINHIGIHNKGPRTLNFFQLVKAATNQPYMGTLSCLVNVYKGCGMLELRDCDGKTALDYATDAGCEDTKQLLIEAGAIVTPVDSNVINP